MSQGVPKPIRAIVGVAALALLLVVVNGWLREYRSDGSDSRPSAEATVTPEGGEVPDDTGEEPADDPASDETDDTATSTATVVVTIEGLNFRREPSQSGEMIRGLSRNSRLTHLGTADGWYHVRDSDGVEGYVSANPQYTELQE